MPWWLIMIIVIVVALAIMFVLYRVGDKLQKKQSAQREQMVEAAQPMNVDHRQENAANERRRTSKNGDGTDTKALPESKASNRKGQGWSTDYEHDL